MSVQVTAKISPPGGPGELVTRAIAGDRDAFATLYNDHRAEVYRYLVNRTRDRHLAEDLTQDVFLRALRRIETFRHQQTGGGFNGWLMTIARNLHTDHLKKARVQREVPVGDVFEADEFDPSAEEAGLRQLEIVEASRTVAAGMTALNPYQQTCIRLRYFEELSVPETAARMGKGIGAVKTLTFRSLRLMEQALVPTGAAA
ncbi:RNA polymerase sigma factor [Streptomyces sp. NPDC003343]